MTGTMLSQLIVGSVGGLVLVLMFFVFRVLLRRQWLAASAFTLLAAGVGVLQSGSGRACGPTSGSRNPPPSKRLQVIMLCGQGSSRDPRLSGVLSASLFLACVLYCGVLPPPHIRFERHVQRPNQPCDEAAHIWNLPNDAAGAGLKLVLAAREITIQDLRLANCAPDSQPRTIKA